MRRAAIAVVLVALALLLVAPFVRGVIFIGVLAALTVGIFIVVGQRVRRSGSQVPWLVSLGISAVITWPQVAVEHFKTAGGRAFGGVFWWLLLAALLRFAISLTDYFRKRHNGHSTGMRGAGENQTLDL